MTDARPRNDDAARVTDEQAGAPHEPRYRPIGSDGLIGDLRAAALVGARGPPGGLRRRAGRSR